MDGETSLPPHNDARGTNCAVTGYFVLAAGVSAPGGLSGDAGALLSVGGVPLSGVVLPLVAEPEGSMGGGGLEPPHATAAKQPNKTKPKLKWDRCISGPCARHVPLAVLVPDLLA